MNGRRVAAAFSVLLAHAFLLYWFAMLPAPADRGGEFPEPATLPITLYPEPEPEPPSPAAAATASQSRPPTPLQVAPIVAPAAAPASPAPSEATPAPSRVDWPLEGKKAAARVLAREAESERIARMFAGPGGTWASLTKRERSRLKRFRWKPGVDGLEYDSAGNAIYHISEGCVIINSGVIGCTIGKAKVHGDLFNDMRLYFDERRLPPTNEGNGTEGR